MPFARKCACWGAPLLPKSRKKKGNPVVANLYLLLLLCVSCRGLLWCVLFCLRSKLHHPNGLFIPNTNINSLWEGNFGGGEKILKDLHSDTFFLSRAVVLFVGACTMPGKLMIVTELLSKNLDELIFPEKTKLPMPTLLRLALDTALGKCSYGCVCVRECY